MKAHRLILAATFCLVGGGVALQHFKVGPFSKERVGAWTVNHGENTSSTSINDNNFGIESSTLICDFEAESVVIETKNIDTLGGEVRRMEFPFQEESSPLIETCTKYAPRPRGF